MKILALSFLMRLKEIKLQNFRNYKNQDFSFGSGNIDVLVGNNAQGKTNFLEAIYLIAVGKSFSCKKQDDLIMWGEEFCRIVGTISKGKTDHELCYYYAKKPSEEKVLMKDTKIIPPTSFIGNLKVVFFSPEDLSVLVGNPLLRRRYMDIVISQCNKNYLETLLQYRKTVRNRNVVLRRINEKRATVAELKIWNTQLVTFGTQLIEERIRATVYINSLLTNLYSDIAKKKYKLTIDYKGYDIESGRETVENSILKELKTQEEHDIVRGVTSVGPHRDDYLFLLDGKPVAEFGSRGEIRSVMLSIKLAERMYINELTGEMPVLLFDDVFSELDYLRQEQFVNILLDHQTVITTTEKELERRFASPVQLWQVNNATISSL